MRAMRETTTKRTFTIADFKAAMRQDGNLSTSRDQLAYATDQIDFAANDGQITGTQRDKLTNWAHDKYGS